MDEVKQEGPVSQMFSNFIGVVFSLAFGGFVIWAGLHTLRALVQFCIN